LVSAEFIVNSKAYSATKVSLFIANYRRELIMKANIRRKRKVKKITEFLERIKRIQKEAGTVLIGKKITK